MLADVNFNGIVSTEFEQWCSSAAVVGRNSCNITDSCEKIKWVDSFECVFVKLVKCDVDDHHSAVNHMTECCQSLLNSSCESDTLSHVLSLIDDTRQRYKALASDVNSRLSELSRTEPRWQQFQQSRSDVNDWLTVQQDHVSQLQHPSQQPDVLLQCQVSTIVLIYW